MILRYCSKEQFISYLKNENNCRFDICNLKGVHNIENILASITVAKLLGIENRYIIESLKSFKGLPHRMEYIGTIDGVCYINDSKATTIHSVQKGIQKVRLPLLY